MSSVLLAIFILALATIVVRSLLEVRNERLGNVNPDSSGRKEGYAEVASQLDLELTSGSADDALSMRGTLGEHWLTIKAVESGVRIDMNYHSGELPFAVGPTGASSGDDALLLTGDDAFDSELFVAAESEAEVHAYFSPARRNALLWLNSAFDVNSIDEEQIRVTFTPRRWRPEALVSAVRLVEDVADIMDAGEKVFMTPPLQPTEDAESETPVS